MTMNALLRRGFGLAGLLLVASASTLAAEESTATSQCTGFRFNLDSELKLFAGTPREINAASTATAPTAIDGATLYRVALVDQSAARFAIPPGKPTVADGSYAGLLRITPTGSSTLRVNLGEAAWIDVVAGGRELESARHTGSHDCKLLRKSVEFSVQPGTELLIQISGSTVQEMLLAVTYSAH